MPRANLSSNKVLDQALKWVDKHGYENLSMATLARSFGVAVPSLYKHVSSLAWIQNEIAKQGIQDLGNVLKEAAMGRAQHDALSHMATAYRNFAKAYPGRYAAIQHAHRPHDHQLQQLSDRTLRPIYDMLATYGRTGEEATHDVRLLRAALHGFVTLETTGAFGIPLDIEQSFNHLINAMDSSFRSYRLL